MSTAFSQIFPTGTQRWRRQLRDLTRPVRGLTDLLAGFKGLRSHIPSALGGQDLLALLSQQLRGALAVEPNLSPAGPLPQTRRRLDVRQNLGELSMAAPERAVPLSRKPSALPALLDALTSVRQEKTQWPPLGNPETRPTGATLHTTEDLENIREWQEASPVSQSGARPLEAAPHREAPAHTWSEGRTPLSQLLRDYWQLTDQPRTKETPGAVPAPGGPSPATVPPLPGWPGARPSSWPEVVGGQLAKKLQEFAKPGATLSQGRESTSQQHGPVAIHNVFQVNLNQGVGDGGSAPTSLAEALADILRQQALQHGINVT